MLLIIGFDILTEKDVESTHLCPVWADSFFRCQELLHRHGDCQVNDRNFSRSVYESVFILDAMTSKDGKFRAL